MAVVLCANCKSRVEEGGVRCVSCGADLYKPGIFQVVLGWVVIAISSIPFAISEVTTSERDWTPLIIGGVIVLIGVGLVLTGRAKNKAAQSRVIAEGASVPGGQPQA